MSKYNHSSYLSSSGGDFHVSWLSRQQRDDLHDFFVATVHPPHDTATTADTPQERFPDMRLGRTLNGIFVVLRQTIDADMSMDPDNHYVATCRHIGRRMLWEEHEIYDLKYARSPQGFDKIMEIKGVTSSRPAVVELSDRALWIELDTNGNEQEHPIEPIRLAVD